MTNSDAMATIIETVLSLLTPQGKIQLRFERIFLLVNTSAMPKGPPMKQLSVALLITALASISGCQPVTSAELRNETDIHCNIEIQIAVRSEPYKTGDAVNSGKYHVLSSNLFPIHSIGGSGHVVSNTNGTIIEICWNKVQLITFDGEKRVQFDDFSYVIKNQIQPPDGINHRFGSSTKSMTLNTEFDWLQSPLAYAVSGQRRSQNRDNHRSLVVRGRLLKKVAAAKPLRISASAGSDKTADK